MKLAFFACSQGGCYLDTVVPLVAVLHGLLEVGLEGTSHHWKKKWARPIGRLLDAVNMRAAVPKLWVSALSGWGCGSPEGVEFAILLYRMASSTQRDLSRTLCGRSCHVEDAVVLSGITGSNESESGIRQPKSLGTFATEGGLEKEETLW